MSGNSLNELVSDDIIRLILHEAPGYIFWKDLNSVYRGCNQNGAFLYSVSSPDEIIGKTDFDFNQEFAEEFIKQDQYVITTGQLHISEKDVITMADGSQMIVRTEKKPLRNKGGQIIGIVGTAIDVTSKYEAERLKIENEKHNVYVEASEKFREIVSQAVHDIGSPLAAVKMMLPEFSVLPEKNRNMLKIAVTRISDITSNLLRKFEPEENRSVELNTGYLPVLVSNDVLEVIAEKRYEYAQLPIEFITFITQPGYFAFVSVNTFGFKRMLSNLINNAVDALEGKPGAVTIHLDTIKDNQIQIIVEDNGKGMPEIVKNKILDNIAVTDGKVGGHGIGFGQIRDTLANSQGRFTIESEPGKGTKIVLTFPAAITPEWICNQIELNPAHLVVILDDEPSIHSAWAARFEKDAPGIKRHHFEQGAEAIAFINAQTDEIRARIFLLTDYELLKQGVNGLAVVKQTGVRHSILATSYHSDPEVHALAKGTNTKILPKTLASEIPIIVSNDIALLLPEELQSSNAETYKQIDLVIVDDNRHFLEAIAKYVLPDNNIDTYDDIQTFLNKTEDYPKSTKILIAHKFAGDETIGLDVLNKLYALGFFGLYLHVEDDTVVNSVPDYIMVISKTESDAIKAIVKA